MDRDAVRYLGGYPVERAELRALAESAGLDDAELDAVVVLAARLNVTPFEVWRRVRSGPAISRGPDAWAIWNPALAAFATDERDAIGATKWANPVERASAFPSREAAHARLGQLRGAAGADRCVVVPLFGARGRAAIAQANSDQRGDAANAAWIKPTCE